MKDINFDTFIKIIKENIKVHITLLIVSGFIIFIQDETIKGIIGIQIPVYIKLFFLIVFLIAFVVFVLDIIECLFNRNKEEKKQAIKKLKEIFQNPNLGKEIDLLYDWDRICQEEAHNEYKKQLQLPIKERSEKFNRTHETRQNFSRFFDQAYKYYIKKLICKQQLKKIIAVSHVRALLDVVEPLEKQISENYDKKPFDHFRDLYDKELNK